MPIQRWTIVLRNQIACLVHEVDENRRRPRYGLTRHQRSVTVTEGPSTDLFAGDPMSREFEKLTQQVASRQEILRLIEAISTSTASRDMVAEA